MLRTLSNMSSQKVKESIPITIDSYMIQFDTTLNNPLIGKYFEKYLETEFNVEPWRFLTEIKKLENSKNNKECIQRISYILEHFVNEGSDKQVNISGRLRKELIHNFSPQVKNEEEWILPFKPQSYFHKAFQIVSNELYHDSWKRFSRSPDYKEIITKYKNDPSICRLRITDEFHYDDKYFLHPYVEDRDFDFAKLLFQDDNHWELIGSKVADNVNIFYTKQNYLPNLSYGKNVRGLKYECVVPCAFQQSLLGYLTNESFINSDPNTNKVETIEYIDYEKLKKKLNVDELKYKRTHGINIIDIVLPFPFNARVAVNGFSAHYDPETKSLVSIWKPFLMHDLQFGKASMMDIVTTKGGVPKRVKTYPLFDWMFSKFQKLDDDKVLFSQVHIMDLGGWLSTDKFLRETALTRGFGFRDTLTKLAFDIPYEATIESYKDVLCKYNKSIPQDGLGILLYDLKIDELDQEYEDSKRPKDQLMNAPKITQSRKRKIKGSMMIQNKLNNEPIVKSLSQSKFSMSSASFFDERKTKSYSNFSKELEKDE
jgi:hypothetical protein